MGTERVVREMLGATTLIASITAAIIMVRWGWKMMKWLWLNPKRLERVLIEQGFQANPYKFWVGDLKEIVKMHEEAKSMPMKSLSHDLSPRFFSFVLHILHKHGKNSFMWFGPTPSLILTSPEQIKDVFNKNYDYRKSHLNPLSKYVAPGLAKLDGDKWAKHRKIISPAFNLDKLKTMTQTLFQCCNDMIREWDKKLSSSNGTCEVDVWPSLMSMTQDVICRAAFRSSYEEGKQIFHLLTEQSELVMNHLQRYHTPFWSFVHGKDLRRIKEIDRMVGDLVKGIIKKKEKALKEGEAMKNDVLSILLESNHKEIEKRGNKKNVGLSMKDIIDECKFFYFGGQATTSSLLAWAIMLLSKYTDWQTRAREEVFQVFGDQEPNFDRLSHLKIVTMILYEVLRLYPPVTWQERSTEKDMKLGDILVPGGVQIFIPILMLHQDQEIWGSDAKEFKPERFSEGISKAGKGNSVAYIPFGWGPRICVGQNFALLEAKMALSLILQNFWFELSPAYSHAPFIRMTLQPQHGVHVILHKL
ncbi:cytochrome P450 72A68-like [Neltuma alba]|uniref:cytochrome P450 72A68-like n=1 Tax=Neltuma alba TaxID=207710 RepID=UPI0010A2C154|nr:cytochrome P450 72A68-like [Prosopis alba]XP_028787160.1 cytochrome P450 72A68-like [Prosopis alba]